MARHEARKLFGDHHIDYCDSLRQTLDDVHAVVLLTRWEEFEKIPELLVDLDPQPLFIDGRRMLDKTTISRYEGIGL